MTPAVTVLGCGVAGLCIAAELSSRGCSVTMIDPQKGPGPASCSWWAGGMLAPDCEGERADETVVRLGREASSWWARQGAEVVRNGSLVVTLERDHGELTRFERRTENHEMLDRDQIEKLEPCVSERFSQALYMQAEAHLDPRKTLVALKDKLIAQGVRICAEATPEGQIIDCRGLSAKDHLPELRGVKGEMVVLRSRDLELQRPVRLLHPRFPLYIVPRGDGVFLLGATQIENGDRRCASVRSVMELLNAAYALHPAFAEAEILEIGVDARPAFPDNLPRISKIDDLISVNGFFRHGYLLAPALARMVGEFLLEGKTPEVWYADND